MTPLCVACRMPVVASAPPRVICSGCARSYPVLRSGIPVLRAGADEACHSTAGDLLALLHRARGLDAMLGDRIARASPRSPALLRIQAAARSNQAYVSKLLDTLGQTIDISSATPSVHGTASLQMGYLIRDWSGQPDSEAMIAQVTASLWRQAGSTRGGTAVVLGAGAGRFAWELTASFDPVIAVELSVGAALTFALLGEGPLDLHEQDDQNVASVAELCTPVRCALPEDPVRRHRLRWMVADALQVPLASGSAAAVFSVYFSDRAPPRPMLDEVVRLLAPGGRFVHLGPFNYRDPDLEATPTTEEWCELVEARGLRITSREWLSHPVLPSRQLVQPVARAFACGAVLGA